MPSAAKRAAERAIALAPDRPESHLAVGNYYALVLADNARGLAAYEAGLRAAPDNADLLTAAALAEQSLNRWDDAVDASRAGLDPRSALRDHGAAPRAEPAFDCGDTRGALAAVDRGLAVAPANLDLIENKAMVFLAQGDLQGARAAIRAAPAEVEPTTSSPSSATTGTFPGRSRRTSSSCCCGCRRVPMTATAEHGGSCARRPTTCVAIAARARVYADSARLGIEETLKATPDDPQRLAFLGLALALLGQKEKAIADGQRAVALAPASRDGYMGPYIQHQLARIYIVAGEPDKALDQIEALLKMPYFLSPAWLRIDPNFAPLRKQPTIQEAGGGGVKGEG